mmetsp:Transcript_4026/g.12364  ORF Transcript_4026/g.12364 Transcript_4026/m.12364 type:complete len:207 (-) Transcript_4026:382-1002(-)
MVIVLAANSRKFKRRLNHTSWGIPVSGQSTCRQRSMVGADAHGNVVLFALQNQWREHFFNFIEFRLVFLVRFVQDILEFLSTVGKVTRVHSNLVQAIRHRHRDFWREVDIGNDRSGVATLQQLILNLLARFRFLHTLNSNSDHFGSGVGASHDFVHRRVHISRIRSRHRLFHNRVIRANFHVTDLDSSGFTSERLRGVRTVQTSRK